MKFIDFFVAQRPKLYGDSDQRPSQPPLVCAETQSASPLPPHMPLPTLRSYFLFSNLHTRCRPPAWAVQTVRTGEGRVRKRGGSERTGEGRVEMLKIAVEGQKEHSNF